MADAPRTSARTILPRDHDTSALYFLLNSLVVPRPIAWVSTVSEAGVTNLAPHSYFTIAASQPPTLAFTSIGDKDTLRNVRSAGEFVINVVNHALVEQMNISSALAPADVSEFELAGVTPAESQFVAVPRVAEAPVAIECALDRVVEIGNGRMIFGTVLAFHIDEQLFNEQDRVDPAVFDAVARMGGSTYAMTRDRFELRRPDYASLVTK